MRRTTMSLACLFVIVFLVASTTAQMPMPKPAPELSKLDYLAGDWVTDGDLKPSPMGPGGKMSSTDHVQWMDGKFFLVMHSKFKGAMGDGTAMAVMGYDPEKKVYTYNEYNSMGQVNHSEGTVTGDTWNWTSDENMGGQTFQGALHHESCVSDFVHVQVRNVEGWHQLDAGHGRQGHEEVAAK